MLSEAAITTHYIRQPTFRLLPTSLVPNLILFVGPIITNESTTHSLEATLDLVLKEEVCDGDYLLPYFSVVCLSPNTDIELRIIWEI